MRLICLFCQLKIAILSWCWKLHHCLFYLLKFENSWFLFLQEITCFTWFCSIFVGCYCIFCRILILIFFELTSNFETKYGYKRNARKILGKPLAVLMKNGWFIWPWEVQLKCCTYLVWYNFPLTFKF